MADAEIIDYLERIVREEPIPAPCAYIRQREIPPLLSRTAVIADAGWGIRTRALRDAVTAMAEYDVPAGKK